MEKNDSVLSMTVLRANGQRLVQVGNHPLADQERQEFRELDRPSGNSHLERDHAPGARSRSAFSRSAAKETPGGLPLPVRLILCLTLATFLLSRLYLKQFCVNSILPRSFPTACIPRSTRLAEGVLIIDTKQQIVLANKAFADKSGRTPETIARHPRFGTSMDHGIQERPVPLGTGDQPEHAANRRPADHAQQSPSPLHVRGQRDADSRDPTDCLAAPWRPSTTSRRSKRRISSSRKCCKR